TYFVFSSRRRHTRSKRDWSSDVCSSDLLLHEEQKPILKRMIAWEIALWYANLYTKDGAKQALYYLNIAISGEKNCDQQRRIAVLLSESLLMLGETAKSQEVIQQQMEKESHPDLYFAMANTVS